MKSKHNLERNEKNRQFSEESIEIKIWFLFEFKAGERVKYWASRRPDCAIASAGLLSQTGRGRN